MATARFVERWESSEQSEIENGSPKTELECQNCGSDQRVRFMVSSIVKSAFGHFVFEKNVLPNVLYLNFSLFLHRVSLDVSFSFNPVFSS